MEKYNTLPKTIILHPYFTIGSISLCAFFLALQLNVPFLTIPISLLYILLLTGILGKLYFPQLHTETQWLMGAIMLLGYYITILTFFFYFYQVTPLILGITTALSPLMVCIRRFKIRADEYTFRIRYTPPPLRTNLAIGAIITIGSLALLLIISSRTLQSVVSPWPLLPPISFTLYASLAFITFTSLIGTSNASWKRLLPLFIVSLCTATILFPLGYGFDPFIHQATERILSVSGTIQPQPLYYIGYYVLITFLVHIVQLPLEIADSYLTMTLAVFLLPLALSAALRYHTVEKKYALLSAGGILLLPYPFLIQSTPQAASFVYALIFIAMATIYMQSILPWWSLLLIAIPASLMHPLTGVPLCTMSLFFLCYKKEFLQPVLRRSLLTLIFALGISSIPAMIVLAAARSAEFQLNLGLHLNPSILASSFVAWHRFTNLDDLIYSFSQNSSLIWILFSVIGLTTAQADKRQKLMPFALLWTMLAVAYLCMSVFIRFNFATDAEQTIFADRIWTLGLLTLVPLALSGIYRIIQSVSKLGRTALLLCILGMSLGVTISWYASYPRFDTREQNTGYSASKADYMTVDWIYTDGGQIPYIVLSNQTVSGVAVKRFGFLHYYNNLLYYPLPTNGPLYKKFLTSLDPASSLEQTLAETRLLTGVDRVYIVLNEYWSSAPILREIYSKYASRQHTIEDNGRVDIFIFESH